MLNPNVPAWFESPTEDLDRAQRFGRWSLATATSERHVEPSCLAFWGGVWTLGAWCRLREGFRNFLPDRIEQFDAIGEVFTETAERGLDAYLRHVGANPGPIG